MSKTLWRPAPWYGRGNWLFTDGTVEQGPTVETTSSQRRWRISGTDMSVQKYDLADKIVHYMRTRAHRVGADLWLEITDDDAELELHYRIATGKHNQKLNFNETPKISFERNSSVPITFEFVHATYPLRVLLWVVLNTDTYGATSVASFLTYRPADTMTPSDHTIRRYLLPKEDWVTGAQFKPPEIDWPLERTSFGTRPRQAAAQFIELLQRAQEVDTVTIPDGRDSRRRATLEFTFTRTNYTQDFYRQALDIVQSGPAMERLAEHLKGIRRELSNLGLVTQEKEGFDLSALLNGKLSEFQVQLIPQEPEDGKKGSNVGRDPHHKVHLDLARGVFAVSCNRHHLEEVAEQWNIAKFKAEMTGDTDVLLAYAEAYNEPAERARLRKIVNERRLPNP